MRPLNKRGFDTDNFGFAKFGSIKLGSTKFGADKIASASRLVHPLCTAWRTKTRESLANRAFWLSAQHAKFNLKTNGYTSLL